MIYPTISIQQPWAHAIFHFGKDVENRSWRLPTRYTGVPVLVHAGKKIDRDAVVHLLHLGFQVPEQLQTGGVVGAVIFTGCTGCCGPDSQWAEKGLYLQWRIGRAMQVPFHPCKGRLGFFDVDYPFSLPGSW